jgi:hypothetical protein
VYKLPIDIDIPDREFMPPRKKAKENEVKPIVVLYETHSVNHPGEVLGEVLGVVLGEVLRVVLGVVLGEVLGVVLGEVLGVVLGESSNQNDVIVI